MNFSLSENWVYYFVKVSISFKLFFSEILTFFVTNSDRYFPDLLEIETALSGNRDCPALQ